MNRLTIRPSTFATTPCDEGYSNWHLVALGLLDTWHAREFIESTIDAPGSVLLDDLLEHTTQPIGAHWKAPRLPVGLSVEQLCRMQGTTLLGHYVQHGALDWRMHVAVRSFEQWIEREVELELRG